MISDLSRKQTEAHLARVLYELLDAHDDTRVLAATLEHDDVEWAAHLDYLRCLQRVGREALARTTMAVGG